MILRKKYFLILSAAVLISGSLVWAHGPTTPQDKTLHPPTQIGLPKSGMEQGRETNPEQTMSEGGLTRSQIADLVYKDQDKENLRSNIKLIFLTIFLVIVALLFYPKKPTLETVSSENTQEKKLQAVLSTPESPK